jgi:uncharacterized cupin superfamily protein
MDTLIGHLSDLPASGNKTLDLPNPVRPELFAGWAERRLGKAVGMTQFGVNHLTLEPGAASSLRHWHDAEDEFAFVLSGTVTLVDDNGEHVLGDGAFAGFPAGVANGHHLVNRSDAPVTLLVVGSRRPGAEVITYPDDAIGPFRK